MSYALLTVDATSIYDETDLYRAQIKSYFRIHNIKYTEGTGKFNRYISHHIFKISKHSFTKKKDEMFVTYPHLDAIIVDANNICTHETIGGSQVIGTIKKYENESKYWFSLNGKYAII